MGNFESMLLATDVIDATAAARMAALKRYNILDTDRDAVFDGIAEIAAALLDTPIAVVNFIADNRQWFKAEIGIGQRELPLDVSICRVALRERGIFVVPDLAVDNRFSCNPLVTLAEGLRFYAGVVLESEGVPIGTVCVLDTKPRAGGISEAQRRGLEALGVQAMAALERSAAATRDRFRLELTEQLRDAIDETEMMEIATEALGRYLGVAQVGFAEVENDQAHILVHRDWNDGTIPSVVGRWHIDDFGPNFIRDIKAGKTIVIPDVELDARTNTPEAMKNFESINVRAILNIGLIRNSQMRALLFTHHPQPRSWTADDVAIVEETVQRLWAAVERMRAETALRESEEQLARALERADIAQRAANAAFYEFDPQTGNGTPSPSMAEITGYAHQDRTLQWWQSLVHPSDLEGFTAAIEAAALHGHDYSIVYRIRHRDGHWLWVSDRGRIVPAGQNGQYIVIGMVVNIDEQRRNEDRLRARDEHLKLALEASNGSSFEWDIREDRVIRTVNKMAVLAETGDTVESFETVRAMVHPDDLELFDGNVRGPWADRTREYRSEHRYVCKGGPPSWVSEMGVFDYDPATGEPLRLIGMAFDITNQRNNEERLRESEALFRTLAEALPALIFMADASGKNIYSNPQFQAYTGMDGEALLGDGWIETLHLDDRERAAQTWEKSWRGGEPYETTYRFRSAAGDYRTFLVRGSPVRDDRGNIVQWFGQCTDIEEAVAIRDDLAATKAALIEANTDLEAQVKVRTRELLRTNRKLQSEIKRREVAQAALIQGQKLEALGQLTAGVAHDFNNILAAVASGMDLIAKRADDDQIKFITGHCRDAAFRGATLVKQMLAFARQEVLAPRSVNLARLADDIGPLINQAIPGNVVSIDFPAELPPVLIDPILLETALLNLAVNARDAMPGGGTLSLTASVTRPGDRHHPAEFKAVEAVTIEVRDSGEGMPPEIVQRVTEPFFTTKAPGSGTGLGLAMVHGFIGQSGGAMHIDSRVGVGTGIYLFLPLSTATVNMEPETVVVSDAIPTAGVGALLLVDDDAAVRTIASIQLRDLGYTVVEADGLASAMTLIEAGEPFDGVVTDVVMPGGDGVALAAAIRSIRPGLPILFMTGRADGKRVAGEQVLHKPFKLNEIATAVADIIGLSDRESGTVAKIASRSSSQCVADMLKHWSAGKFVGKVPAFTEFDADVCSEPHKLAVVIADPSQLPMRFQLVSAGKDLEDLLGRPMSDTEFDVRGADGFGSIEESYRRAVKTRLPVFDYMKMDFGDGGPERFERLILPYSSGGGLVDRLVSVVVFAKDT